MQTGVADGLESPAMVALDNKFNEVTKSIVKTHHMFGSMAIFGNNSRLGKLSAEQQAILAAAGKEAAEWSNKTISEPGEEDSYKKMTALGMEVAEPAKIEDWSKPMQPMWGEFTAKTPGSDKFLKMIIETK